MWKRIRVWIKLKLHLRHYTLQGDPIKCPVCGSTAFVRNTVDRIDMRPCEQEILCHNGHSVAYWAHGHYDTNFIPED